MRQAIRSIGVLFIAVLGVVGVAIAATIGAAVALAASALIVPGTGTPNANLPSVAGYKENARNYYMGTTPCDNAADCPDQNLTGVNYPASFFPLAFIPNWCVPGRCEKWDDSVGQGVTGLDTDLTPSLGTDDKVVLFGYSQGAAVVSNELRALGQLDPDQTKNLSAVLIGDIDNPDGGLFTRLGFLGHIPFFNITTGLATPVDSGIPLTVINFEYDGVGDFPRYGGNLLADLNAILGFYYIHGTYLLPNASSMNTGLPDGYDPAELLAQQNCATHASNCRYDYYPPGSPNAGQIRNTFVLIPTTTLPLVVPLLDLGAKTGTTAIVKPIVDLISPALRVLIDLGYDRTVDPGVAAPLSPLQFNPKTFKPLKVTAEVAVAIAQGIKAALGDLGVPKATIVPPETPDTASLLATTPQLSNATPLLATRKARLAAASAPSDTDQLVAKPVKTRPAKIRPGHTLPVVTQPEATQPVDQTPTEPGKGVGKKGFGSHDGKKGLGKKGLAVKGGSKDSADKGAA